MVGSLYPFQFLNHCILCTRRVILLLMIASIEISVLYILLAVQYLVEASI